MDAIWTIFNWVSFLLGIASFILAIIAIWQAMYWYRQAKDAEANTREILAEIRATSKTLEKVAGRQLDKFVEYFTGRNPDASAVDTMLTVLTTLVVPQREPGQGYPVEDVVRDKCAIAYLAFYGNLALQGYINRDPAQQATATQQFYARLLQETKTTFQQTMQILGMRTVRQLVAQVNWEDWFTHLENNAAAVHDIYEMNSMPTEAA